MGYCEPAGLTLQARRKPSGFARIQDGAGHASLEQFKADLVAQAYKQAVLWKWHAITASALHHREFGGAVLFEEESVNFCRVGWVEDLSLIHI